MTMFSFKVEASKNVQSRVDALAENMKDRVADELTKGALKIQATAKKSIQSSAPDPQTGRSRPGNPPKTDTGRLVNSIYVNREDNVVEVGSNVKYATYLEFGTRFMAARPFLGPAFRKARKDIDSAVRKVVNSAIVRGSKK